MRLSFSSAPNPTNLLGPWLQRLRTRLDLPLLLRWQGGSGFKLGEFDQPRVTIDVLDAAGAAALLSPSLDNLGQAYVEGHIDVSGTVQDMVDMAYRLAEAGAQLDAGGHWLGRVVHHLTDATSHTKAADREAIHYHYDVSNAFYAEWLDPAMVYSCAYFENGDETLAQAQTKKIDHILTKLRLRPGQRLLDVGCEVLMPWGAPIGSGQGLINPWALRTLRERWPDVPMVVDAGIGSPAHAVQAMELGYDAVLLNSAVSQAREPVRMAAAFGQAVQAGRLGFEAGVMAPQSMAVATTPVGGRPFLL